LASKMMMHFGFAMECLLIKFIIMAKMFDIEVTVGRFSTFDFDFDFTVVAEELITIASLKSC